MRHIIACILFITVALAAHPASPELPDTPAVSTLSPTPAPDIDTTGFADIHNVKPKKNIIEKIIAYFNESNKPKKNKKFDFSIIGGPHYSSDTKFGI